MDISMIVLASVICTLFGYLAGVFTMDMFQKAAQKRGQASIGAAGGKVTAPPMPEAKGGGHKELYLLSFDTLRQAEVVAGELGLTRGEYVHIPYWADRGRAMAGRYVSDEKYLVGAFTKSERCYLLRRQLTNG